METKVKQEITIGGKISADVFNLPCVRGAYKEKDGRIVYRLALEKLANFRHTEAQEGDVLCEQYDGQWIVRSYKH